MGKPTPFAERAAAAGVDVDTLRAVKQKPLVLID
jgi:hypothetical protein